VSDQVADSAESGVASSPMPVPQLLRDLAGWTWRILVLVFAGVVLIRFFDHMTFVVLPLFAAILATSLAYPLVRFLRGKGVHRVVATWITVLLALVVFGGVAIFVVNRAIAGYPDLVEQTKTAVTHFQHFLVKDLHVHESSTTNITKTINDYLDAHQTTVAANALTGIATVTEGLAAFVLWFFMTFFLLYDGDHIWEWIVGMFPATARPRVLGAGEQAWDRLAGFVRGTFIIAVVHAIVAAVALSILGVPLVAPLAILVFIGSFLPIVGSISVGVLSVGITLVTQGFIEGAILAGVLIADNQIEAHVLQPFLVGRYVRLHPLAVAISIAGGGVIAGIPGAILAVPFVAVMYAVVHYLATGESEPASRVVPEDRPPDGPPADSKPDDSPPPSATPVPSPG
jgi:predicted PurR-regulated permease PerM